MSFPIDAIGSQFPALYESHGTIFFDNAAGAQLPARVIDAVKDHLVHRMVQRGGPYTLSREVDDVIERARAAVADLVNASDPNEIVFGLNGTSFMRLVSQTMAEQRGARNWSRGFCRCGSLPSPWSDRRAEHRYRLHGVFQLQGVRAAHGFWLGTETMSRWPAGISRILHPGRCAAQVRDRDVRLRKRCGPGGCHRVSRERRPHVWRRWRSASGNPPRDASHTQLRDDSVRSHASRPRENSFRASVRTPKAIGPYSDLLLHVRRHSARRRLRKNGRARVCHSLWTSILSTADQAPGPFGRYRRHSRFTRPLQHEGRD